MPIDSDEFRDVLRCFASGVTIVTVRCGEEVHGLTVSAFVSVSAEPPLVAVVIDRGNSAHPLLERDETTFAVNILGEEHTELANRFAWVRDEDRFAEGTWASAQTGAPVLVDAAAWLDCTIHSRTPAGSHAIYVGEVQACAVSSPEKPPLLYWNRGYRRLALLAEPAASPDLASS